MCFLRKTTQKARTLDFKHSFTLWSYACKHTIIHVLSNSERPHSGEPGFEGRREATKEERPSIKYECYGVPQNDRRKCNFNLAKFNNVHWCFSSEKNVSMYFFIICFWMFLCHHQSLPPQKLRFLCFCDFFLIQKMFVFQNLLLNNLVEIENWRPESNFDPRL